MWRGGLRLRHKQWWRGCTRQGRQQQQRCVSLHWRCWFCGALHVSCLWQGGHLLLASCLSSDPYHCVALTACCRCCCCRCCAGQSVVNVYINKDKNFAFVEFRTGGVRHSMQGIAGKGGGSREACLWRGKARGPSGTSGAMVAHSTHERSKSYVWS